MPFLEEKPRFRGITLPPGGWVLTALLVIYIFTGLIGHDPWKHDDAISIGIAHDIAAHGNWLILQLAGRPYPDAPLYYWFAATIGRAFSWLMPFHDAARMTSGVFTLLALEFILLAARELHGRENAAAAPLILAGSIGFLFHAHEAQPMLVALTAYTAAYWALALAPRHDVLLWGRFESEMRPLIDRRENTMFLTGFTLPDSMRLSFDLDEAIRHVTGAAPALLIVATPVAGLRPLHVLVIPKRHIASLAEVGAADEPVLGRVLAVAHRLARENGSPDGCRVIINSERIGGQEVPHLHAHVVGGPEPVGPMLKRN